MANIANIATPIDCGDGIVVKSITMEGKDFCYNVTFSDDEMCELMRDYPEIFTQAMKSSGIVESLRHDVFDDDAMLNALVRLGITINLKYYAEGESKPILIFPITSKELKNI